MNYLKPYYSYHVNCFFSLLEFSSKLNTYMNLVWIYTKLKKTQKTFL